MTESSSVELVWVDKSSGEYSNNSAFSVINKNGDVISWGNSNQGGDNSSVASKLKEISEIFSNEVAFAALKRWFLLHGDLLKVVEIVQQ